MLVDVHLHISAQQTLSENPRTFVKLFYTESKLQYMYSVDLQWHCTTTVDHSQEFTKSRMKYRMKYFVQ